MFRRCMFFVFVIEILLAITYKAINQAISFENSLGFWCILCE